MALKLDILANTRQFVAESKKAGSSLDDIGDSLEDLAREARTTGDKTGRSIDDIGDAGKDTARDIDSAGDRMERTFRDLVKDAKKTDTAIGKVGDAGKKGFGKANEAAGDFKDEALSNFSEVTSSFDGSMSSIQDLAQGTLGGLASSGLPGVGIAAGLAAAGIGLIGAGLEDAEERRKVLEERASDLAQAYLDAGSTVLDSLILVDRFAGVLQDPETRKEAEKLADLLGGDLAMAARILAGDEEALTAARGAAVEMTKEQALGGYELTRALEDQTKVMRDAKNDARLISDQYKQMISDAGGAALEVDELGNELYTLPTGKQIVVDAKTGLASQNIANFKGDLDGIKDKTATVRVDVDDSAWRRWVPTVKEGIVVGKPAGNKNWQIG